MNVELIPVSESGLIHGLGGPELDAFVTIEVREPAALHFQAENFLDDDTPLSKREWSPGLKRLLLKKEVLDLLWYSLKHFLVLMHGLKTLPTLIEPLEKGVYSLMRDVKLLADVHVAADGGPKVN